MADGYLDANIFIHAYANDVSTDDCRRFLLALEAGRRRAVLEPVVLHELSYALPRYLKQLTREDVADYLLMVVGWAGIECAKDLLVDGLQRWRATPGLGFTDAYLAALAAANRSPVFTKNVAEFRAQGVAVLDPLPT